MSHQEGRVINRTMLQIKIKIRAVVTDIEAEIDTMIEIGQKKMTMKVVVKRQEETK